MIFTLTDRNYNALDAYETDDYLIGQYIGSILETLEMEVSVKSLNAQHWIQGHYIMCTDKTGRNYWFTIYDVDDSLSSDYKKISCFSGTIDIVSEEFPPIKATSPQPFTWYLNQIFVDTGIVIGINEIADMKRTLEFEGTNHTNVEMLQFVLNGFDNADARLEVEFDGVRPVKIVLNVYKHLGAIEPQELLTSEVDNLEELERKGSISELATGLRATGEETDGKALTLKGKYFEEKDSDGNILYYSPKDRIEIFSVQGRQNFFVDLPNKSNGEFDGYIVRDYPSQAKTQDALWREALIKLKKIDHANIEYEARGYITCDLGDNVQIVAHEMKPPVMISARVTEYKFNDDDSSRNEYKFNNFVELESNMSELDKIIADIKKDIDYVVDMKVDYAIGNDNVTVPVTWVEKEPNVPQGKYLWTRTSTYMSKGAVIPAYSITYVAIDGKDGIGKDGVDGKDGIDGKDTYVHKAWSWSSDGTDRFTVDYPNENLKLGTSSEWEYYEFTGWVHDKVPQTELIKDLGLKTGDTFTSYGTYRPTESIGVISEITWLDSIGTRISVSAGNVINLGEEGVSIITGIVPQNAVSVIINDVVALTNFGTKKGYYKKRKFEKGSPTIYTPSPKDDFENAYPKYEGYYSSHNPVQSTNPSDYTWTVDRGENGTDGKDGVTPKDVISGHLLNESIIVPATPTGAVTDFSKAFGDFVVFEGQNKLVNGVAYSKVSETGMASSINASGRYTVTNITTDTAMAIYRATYKGVQIDKQVLVVKNKQGATGSPGVGVSSTKITYQAGVSGTATPTGTWSDSVPTVSENQFLWTRTITTYTDNTSSTGYSVSKMGGKGATGTGVSNSAVTYASSTSGVTPPSNWSTNIPTVVEGNYLWTRTILTFSDNTTNTSYSVAKQGVTGPKGDPTGITVSNTQPTSRYVGMLWQDTSQNPNQLKRWNGSYWELFIFYAVNIKADNLQAISAMLGDVEGGSFTGGKFVNYFTDVPLIYNNQSRASGQMTIENGEITISGFIDKTYRFVAKYSSDAISSTIYQPDGTSVRKAFSITPDGILLSNANDGFVGQLLASNLTETPWITLPLRTGYSIAEDNPPQYRIIYNLDGTKEIVFRGQFKKNSGTMNAGSEQWFIQIPENIYPTTTIMKYGAADNGNGCRLSMTTFGRFAAIIGVTASNYVEISSMTYQIK